MKVTPNADTVSQDTVRTAISGLDLPLVEPAQLKPRKPLVGIGFPDESRLTLVNGVTSLKTKTDRQELDSFGRD